MERVTKIIGKKVEISCNQDKRLNTTIICGNKACAIIFKKNRNNDFFFGMGGGVIRRY